MGTTITSWTVTTSRACTIQPFWSGVSLPWVVLSEQNYYPSGVSEAVTVPSAGTYTFPWTPVKGSATLPTSLSTLGWLTTAGNNCVSSSFGTGSGYLISWAAKTSPNPIWWNNEYFGSHNTFTLGNFAIRLNYAATTGVPTSMECKNCDANYYRSSNTKCTACTANSVSVSGSISVNDCKCKAGYYMSGGVCVKCTTSGTYCPLGATSVNTCVAGSYCPTTDTMIPCTANYYCPDGSTTGVACPANTPVSPPGCTSLVQCEVNRISVNIDIDGVNASLSQSQFQQALPSNVVINTYDELVVSDQSKCPSGYYCPADTTTPIACPAGKYNDLQNQDAESDCKVCGAGFYCPLASTNPVNCAAGSYRGSEGGVSQDSCTVCPTGNYCPIGSINPTNCTAGTYEPTTAGTSLSSCLACPPGDYCPKATTTPIQCLAGSYRGSTGGVSQGSCTACPSGNFCPVGSVDPTNCSISTYRASGGAVASTDCLTCPVGQFCPTATTAPTSCAAGTYRSSTGAGAQSDCTECPIGNFCPVQSVNPTMCFAGTYNPATGKGAASDCQVCVTGKYSLDTARSVDCPLCQANSYCSNSTSIKTCPANTVSSAGSSSLLHCRCEAGYKCSYTKKITAVVTLNTTVSSFNDLNNPIRIAFISAVAAAAGVSTSQVTIGNVVTKTPGTRRLLSSDDFIDVHTTIEGATRLHQLAVHLAGHSATLHQGHTWQEAHMISSHAVLRRPVLSTR